MRLLERVKKQLIEWDYSYLVIFYSTLFLVSVFSVALLRSSCWSNRSEKKDEKLAHRQIQAETPEELWEREKKLAKSQHEQAAREREAHRRRETQTKKEEQERNEALKGKEEQEHNSFIDESYLTWNPTPDELEKPRSDIRIIRADLNGLTYAPLPNEETFTHSALPGGFDIANQQHEIKETPNRLYNLLMAPQTPNETREKVKTQLEERAENGDAEAARKLGDYYWNGVNGKSDKARGFEYYLKAAQQGDVDATKYVARCYLKGEGVARNKEKGFEYLLSLKDKQDREVWFDLGYCYEYGVGVKASLSTALKWYRKAADAYMPEANDAIARIEGKNPYSNIRPYGLLKSPDGFYRPYLQPAGGNY